MTLPLPPLLYAESGSVADRAVQLGRLLLRVQRLGPARRPLLTTQGGVHRGAPSPCAAPPPRLALSGALVLNAGNVHSQPPAALCTACTQPRWLEPRDGYPGCDILKFRGLSWNDHIAGNYEGNVPQVFFGSFLMIFYQTPESRGGT